MAKFKGVVQFTGTINGMTGVSSKEGLYLRAKQVISKDRYKKGPEYASFRMNGKYMGIAAKMSTAFRWPFTIFGRGACDMRMYSRMNAVMRRILMCDPISRRGEFSIAFGINTPEGKKQLLDFEFNKFVSFDNIFKGEYVLDTQSGTIILAQFSPKASLKLASGSTHVVLESGVLVFNFETQEGIFRVSVPLQLANTEEARDIVLSSEVPNVTGGVVCYFLKISFVQEVGGLFYPLKGNDGGVMKIVGVK